MDLIERLRACANSDMVPMERAMKLMIEAAAALEAARAEVAKSKHSYECAARALFTEAARAERLAEALRDVLPFVATQAIGCHGDKCREEWCYSCNGEDDAEQAAQRGSEAFYAARSALQSDTTQEKPIG